MGMDINSLSGIQFENVCQNLIEHMGFSVETTKASGDGGIDLIAYNHEPVLSGKYIIQCKRYSGSVGEPIIRDLYGVITSERANKGILMTTGHFTKSAISFAEGKQIELIDGAKLNGLLIKYGMPTNTFSAISNEDILGIEQEIDKCNLEFRKSYNRFDSEINVLLFSVNDEELYNDILEKYITLRIYEAVQSAIYSLKCRTDNIAIFAKILKDMRLGSGNISEYQSIYNKFLSNEDDYKTILHNTAMPHDDEFIGGFWLDLMVTASRYNENDTLKNIIVYHEEYLKELAKIIQHFTESDLILEWVKEYKESLDLLINSIG